MGEPLCSKKQLKNEAINWIKQLHKDGGDYHFQEGKKYTDDLIIGAQSPLEFLTVAGWIQYFFNIKEEEIK